MLNRFSGFSLLLTIIIYLSGCSKNKNQVPSNNVVQDSSSIANQADSKGLSKNKFISIVNKVALKPLPFSINDSTLIKLDTSITYSETETKALRLRDVFGKQEHFKFVPYARFEIDSSYILLLVFKYYLEESYASLIKYSISGELIDKRNVFYDNSGGDTWMNAVLSNTGKLILYNGSIDENEGQPVVDSIELSKYGSFFHSAGNTPKLLKINGADYPATFYHGHHSSFNLEYIPDEFLINDSNFLKSLWPDSSDRYVPGSSNGTFYFYSYQSRSNDFQEFTIHSTGGCDELWYFIFDRKGNSKGSFLVSNTCASDADDYASGHFLSDNIYEKVTTWIMEYPEEGEQNHKRSVDHYIINDDGTVSVKEIQKE